MTELFAEIARDTRGLRRGVWARRAWMTLFAAIAVLGLADVFGQRTSARTATGSSATLRVVAPERIRGGLLFQTRVEITATQSVRTPELVLDPGVLEGMQVSSIEPGAASEASRDGRLVLSYDPIGPDSRLTVWMQFQVDPTSIGTHSYGVELDDGGRRVARVQRDLEVLP